MRNSDMPDALHRAVDENLKRAYQSESDERIPDLFATLLAQLRERETGAQKTMPDLRQGFTGITPEAN